MRALEGYIFDLDGTLADSMGIWDQIDYDFLCKRNISVPEDLRLAIKNLNFSEAAVYFIERFQLCDPPEAIMEEWKAMALEAYENSIRLKPGVVEYLKLLKARGKKIALATSSAQPLLQGVLKNNGVYHLFDAVCTIDEVSRGKAFPDIYLLAADRLGLEPECCVVFEDIFPAVLAAKAAGMRIVGVYDAVSACEWEDIRREADMCIEGFHDMDLKGL